MSAMHRVLPSIAPFGAHRTTATLLTTPLTAQTPPIPTRAALIREVQRYANPDTPRGIALFALDISLFGAALAGVLFLPLLWQKVASAIFAGMVMGRVFSLAHNAAHENIVRGRSLNRFMATVLFVLVYYNCRLWMYEHHVLHHPFPNDTKPDAYRPFNKAQFDALPRWRRRLEQFYRVWAKNLESTDFAHSSR